MFVVPGKASRAGQSMRFVDQELRQAGHRICSGSATKLASSPMSAGGIWAFFSTWQFSLGAGSVSYKRITELNINRVCVAVLRFNVRPGGVAAPSEDCRFPAVPMTYAKLIPRRKHVRST